jgi:hypothetical protein
MRGRAVTSVSKPIIDFANKKQTGLAPIFMSFSCHGRACLGHPRGSACMLPQCSTDREPTVFETTVWLDDVDGWDKSGHDGEGHESRFSRFIHQGQPKAGEYSQ